MAKPIVKFVSADYVKQNTTIELNVDDAKLNSVILKAQRIYIQQVLGSYFYEHLSTQISGNTLTTLEEDLMRDYIQPALSEWTLYEVLPFLNYKATNKAVSKQSSEFSEASTLDEIKYLRNSVRDMASFFTQRLTKYLCDYQHLFPKYASPVTPENLSRKTKNYFSGVYIPKKTGNTLGLPTWDEPDCSDC
jgi:hypothetical protein